MKNFGNICKVKPFLFYYFDYGRYPITAIFGGFYNPEKERAFLEILKCRTRYITVAVEDVYQMHNMSAVIRSCDIFGIQEAHLIENRFGKPLDKSISMGAQQWMDIKRYGNTKDCIATLRQDGYRIVATTYHNGCTGTVLWHSISYYI